MADHVELSPSSAKRWMACPASVPLQRGIPDRTSAAAAEGTIAHELAELTLVFKHERCNDVAVLSPKNRAKFPKEMCEYVQEYVDEVRRITADANHVRYEAKLSLAALNPAAEISGTADVFSVVTARRHLDIVDLKYGKGVVVEAHDNPQLLTYAAMGLLYAEAQGFGVIETVTITIVQPRAAHFEGTVRSVTYHVLRDVDPFIDKLLAAAAEAMKPDADKKLLVGEHCRWCKAQPTCPAQRQAAGELAQEEFAVVDVGKPLPDPKAFATDDIGQMLIKAKFLASWVKALDKELCQRIKEGQPCTTHKFVQSRGRRQWKDDPAIITELVKLTGKPRELVSVEKPIGITEVEKMLKSIGKTLPKDLTDLRAGGVALAPSSDPRPAVAVDASTEFSFESESE